MNISQRSNLMQNNSSPEVETHADEVTAMRNELQRIYMIIASASSTLDIQELTTMLLTSLHEILPFDFAGLELLNDDGDTFTYFAPEVFVSVKTKENYISIPSVRLSSDPPDSLISTVFQTRRSVFLRETNVDDLPPYQKAHFAITPWVSLLMVPMESMGRIIGCVIFSGQETFDLDDDGIRSIERYVQQFTFAFVNARQHYQLQQAQKKIQAHLEEVEQQKNAVEQAALEAEMVELFVRVINREKDFEPLIKTILYQIGYIIPSSEKASVMVYQPETEDFRFLQVAGYDFEEFRSVSLSKSDTLDRWMTHETEAAPGIFIVRTFSRKKFETVQSPPLSALAIRLEVEGELAGLIFLDSFTGKDVFTADDVRRAAALSEHINVAFAKALALQRLRRQRQQLQESYNYLGVLSEIARDITSTLDLETVLNSLYRHINRLMDAGYFAIGLYESYRNVLRFELVIREGKRSEAFEYAINAESAEKHLAVWCLQHRTEVLIQADERTSDGFGVPQARKLPPVSAMEFAVISRGGGTANTHHARTEAYSAESQMYVPLVAKDTIVGVVAVQSQRRNAYTHYHLDMLRSIASNAVSALVNAEAFTEIQRQQHILEEQAAEIELINSQLIEQNMMLERSEQLLQEQTRNVEEINSVLQETNLDLEKINAEKNELLGIVAHDLKNPLTAILMSIELLQRFADKMSSDEKEQRLTSIRTVALRMNDIIAHLLDVNALETGSLRLHLQSCDLATFVEEALRDYRERASAKKITLQSAFVGKERVVQADARILREIIDNLLSNAVKFSPFEKSVTLTLRQTPGAVRLEVQDEGPGISSEDMTKLFSKYTRLSARPTAGEGSTGLGLSIVKKMVEAMNGRVWCESEVGKGATFIVELPSANP